MRDSLWNLRQVEGAQEDVAAVRGNIVICGGASHLAGVADRVAELSVFANANVWQNGMTKGPTLPAASGTTGEVPNEPAPGLGSTPTCTLVWRGGRGNGEAHGAG